MMLHSMGIDRLRQIFADTTPRVLVFYVKLATQERVLYDKRTPCGRVNHELRKNNVNISYMATKNPPA